MGFLARPGHQSSCSPRRAAPAARLRGCALAAARGALAAAGGALAYVRETQRGELAPLSSVALYDPSASAGLDRATRSCLEVLETHRDRRKQGSLLGVVDRTATAMGARLLRQWLTAPLVDPEAMTMERSPSWGWLST